MELTHETTSEAGAKVGFYAPILRPRRTYQRGSVLFRPGKRTGGTWRGRWRANELTIDGKFVTVRHSVKLGTKEELPTEAKAREALALHVVQALEDQSRVVKQLQGQAKRRLPRKPQARYEAYLDRQVSLARKYKLTPEDVDAMIRSQGGRCAVCSEPCQDFHIDHNHANTKVRALLCRHCNSGLGFFRDRPDVLRAAAAYIESHHL